MFALRATALKVNKIFDMSPLDRLKSNLSTRLVSRKCFAEHRQQQMYPTINKAVDHVAQISLCITHHLESIDRAAVNYASASHGKEACPVTTILVAALIGLSIALAFAVFDACSYRKLLRIVTTEAEQLRGSGSQARDVANEFLNSCRLLSIHRNGRLNVFTFARGDQIFTVETMGLLSDNPDEWRTMAGLTQ